MPAFRPVSALLRFPALLALLLSLTLALGGCINDSTTNPSVADPVVDDDNNDPEPDPAPDPDPEPEPAGPTSGLKLISSGTDHNCTITNSNDNLWCWGANDSGQLGTGNTNDSSNFNRISNDTWASVSSGDSHSCAIRKQDDSLFCWGNNDSEQLGTATPDSNEPLPVAAGKQWLAVAAGTDHSCAILKDPIADTDPVEYTYPLYCWGDNSRAQLGDDTIADDQGNPVALAPTQIGSATDWSAVSLGNQAGCAIKQDQSLWCWGDNTLGRLGIDPVGADDVIETPRDVSMGMKWSKVVIGTNHGCAIADDINDDNDTPTLYCWGGDNAYGQLGQGDTTASTTPVTVQAGTAWSAVAVGDSHTCAIKDDGTLWCWGNNAVGQLGLGTTSHQRSPTQVGDSNQWQAVSAGKYHTCALDNDYIGHCWGLNDRGQLAAGNPIGTDTPRLFDATTTWQSIDSGAQHSCGLKIDPDSPTLKSLWCGGGNGYGQLGMGSTANQAAAVQIRGPSGLLKNWQSFATGHFHSCAITDSGTLYCWGRNSHNQLGRGAAAETGNIAVNWSLQTPTTPAAPDDGADWVKVATGASHSCGIKNSTELWCWGDNSTGQIGNGASGAGLRVDTPTKINNDAWLDVSVGGYIDDSHTEGGHTCAIKADNSTPAEQGTLWCWGENNAGQLGNGDNTDYAAPQAVTIDTSPVDIDPDFNASWISIKAGNDFTCGLNRTLKSEDMLYCWGNSTVGQLGIGTVVAQSEPQLVDNGAMWLAYDLGQRSVCAVNNDNRLRCWGDNTQNQLTARIDDTQTIPASASFTSDWAATAMGDTHGCGIRANSAGDRSVYCWGEGAEYQFGDGNAWKTAPQQLTLQ